jgi:hypothetical protein
MIEPRKCDENQWRMIARIEMIARIDKMTMPSLVARELKRI